jgi:2-hydroxy-3-keto-5-methylthiopentenyl-1-phosphate phosphatase
VREAAGDDVWSAIDGELEGGGLTVRAALTRQAALLRTTLDEADALLRSRVRFDPAFAAFTRQCLDYGMSLVIVSSGAAPLIRFALERAGLDHVPLVANEIDVTPDGWRIRFRDHSPNGTDKVSLVRAARERGERTVFIGDGISDVDAARIADVRYAKAGRSLELLLAAAGLPFVTFRSFAELDPAEF